MSIAHCRPLLFLALACFLTGSGGHAIAAQQNTAKITPIRLMLPVACTPGQDCWIVNQLDMNPQDGQAEDFTCGGQTYDGHEGIDFGLRDAAAMQAGVSVLAAAPGKVLRMRNTMDDIQPSPEQLDAMIRAKQSCGNGVLIDHGDGWQTISCQLKKGSILVKPGDTVTTGQKIAEIGQSGAAEFPHLHFGLFYQPPQANSTPRAIDPFSGSFADQGCGKMQNALWEIGLNVVYDPFSVFASGFATAVPDFDKIRAAATSPETAKAEIDALTYWVGLFGVQKGDKITLDILTPDGKTFATQTITQENDRARQYYFVGRRVAGTLPPGTYRGMARIERPIDGSATNMLTRSAEKEIRILP